MKKPIEKEEKRQQIMKTAIELFIKKGYKMVTTREIAAEAGVSKGILYHYFKNKDDLFEQTICEHMFKTIADKTLLLKDHTNPREHLDKWIELCCGAGDHINKRFHMMFDFIIYCSDEKKMREVNSGIYDEMRSIIRHIITDASPELSKEPQKLDIICNMIIAFVDGIHFQHFINPKTSHLAETNEYFWNIITGILPQAQHAAEK